MSEVDEESNQVSNIVVCDENGESELNCTAIGINFAEKIQAHEEKGRPLPKLGDWDVNDPASAEGFTVIFNKARDEKKTGGKPDSPSNVNPGVKHAAAPVKKPPAKGWLFCMQAPSMKS